MSTQAGWRDGEEYYCENLRNLDFAERGLERVIFEDCDFTHCRFSGTQFRRCRFNDCRFTDCNLSNIAIPDTRVNGARFERCKLIGVDWTRAAVANVPVWPQLQFIECVLNDASFFGVHSEQIVLRACKVHEADFREGRFARGDFSACDLHRSLFGRTDLSACNFSDAINYDIDLANNRISGARFSRSEAVRLLNFLDIELTD